MGNGAMTPTDLKQFRPTNKDLKMHKDEIAKGVALAKQAVYFAFFNNVAVTAGECRKAIVTLFGPEIDAALNGEFAPDGMTAKDDKQFDRAWNTARAVRLLL
jgi:hypothetical protein